MDDYVGNIDYLVQLIGIDHVAIASDYTYQISMSEAEQKAGWKMMIDSGAWSKEAYPYDVLACPQGIEPVSQVREAYPMNSKTQVEINVGIDTSQSQLDIYVRPRGITSRLRTPRREPNKPQAKFESINPLAY